MKIILFIILLLSIYILYSLYEKNSEYMTELSNNDTINKIQLNTDNFSDIIFYNNDNNDDFFKQKLGINKCIEDPKSYRCIEFGITGTAYGFPKK
jgi:NifU-like protein involved in Fe-S cluster formation